MTAIDQLRQRVERLAPVAGKDDLRDLRANEQAIREIIMEIWPTFDQDNPDLLAPGGAGVSRCFADPRYREIERRVFALQAGGTYAGH